MHGLRTPGEKIAFTAQPKIQSQSQVLRYGQRIFCLPHRPKFSDFFELCLHWVSVVRDLMAHTQKLGNYIKKKLGYLPIVYFMMWFDFLNFQFKTFCQKMSQDF